MAQTAPWDGVASEKQLFVLITGANGGIGLAACERLIDEFLATRALDGHLVLLPTTRSAGKSREAVRHLRGYAEEAARTSKALRSRAGSSSERSEDQDAWDWASHAARVHVISPQLDLCDLRGVHALARRLCEGTVGNPAGTPGPDGGLSAVRIPRLDSVIFNAAYGGWSGFSMLGFIRSFFAKGFVTTVTWPDFKIAMPTGVLNEMGEYGYPPKPRLGQVFAACVLGHHMLARQLVPLLSRAAGSPLPAGRIIWTSSLEAHDGDLVPGDMQAFDQARPPYESAKRLTDLMMLSYTLPSVQPLAGKYLEGPGASGSKDGEKTDRVAPRIYVSHPGLVASSLFPVPWFLFWAYSLAMTLARLVGSPWHVGNAYRGAHSVVWLTLHDEERLDALDAQRSKWGSATDPAGHEYVKRTEVDGWGWTGSVEDAGRIETGDDSDVAGGAVVPNLRWARGRKSAARPVTEEELVRFEELGRECWVQVEGLREEWEGVLGL